MEWTHGNIPTNDIKFDLLSQEHTKICSMDIKVEAFQDHIIEELLNEEKNEAFQTQIKECVEELGKFAP